MKHHKFLNIPHSTLLGFYVCTISIAFHVTSPLAQPASTTASSTCEGGEAASANNPNVLLIVLDDVGWKDLDTYCPHPNTCATTNLRALRNTGVQYKAAYAPAPVCSPSRASILTGVHSAKIGMTSAAGHYPAGNIHKLYSLRTANGGRADKLILPRDVTRLNPSQYTTLAKELQNRGYKTAHFGKWHLGKTHPIPLSSMPQDHGFGFIFPPNAMGEQPPYKEDVFCAIPENRPCTRSILTDERYTSFSENFGYFFNGSLGGWLDIFTPYASITAPTGWNMNKHLEDLVSEKAVDYINERKVDECKYFLNYWTFGAHLPLQSKDDDLPEAKGIFKDWSEEKRKFYGLLKNLDRKVGDVIAATNRSNTLIILTSDNGALADDKIVGKIVRNNDPLVGEKATLYDGGVRVPFIISKPFSDTESPAVTGINHNLFSLTDIFATVLSAADASVVDTQCGTALAPVASPPLWCTYSKSHLATLTSSSGPRTQALMHFPHGRDREGAYAANPILKYNPYAPSSALVQDFTVNGVVSTFKIIRRYYCPDNQLSTLVNCNVASAPCQEALKHDLVFRISKANPDKDEELSKKIRGLSAITTMGANLDAALLESEAMIPKCAAAPTNATTSPSTGATTTN